MKKQNGLLAMLAGKIKQNENDFLEGGFSIISYSNNQIIIGGEESNNCNGQNCVSGCGGDTNNVIGCGSGGGTNVVQYCGGIPPGKI